MMTQTEKQRQRLIGLLKDLFQLNQPDLDFGFYKIMHAKSAQVSEFLEKDLLKIVQVAFGKVEQARIAETQAAYEAEQVKAKEEGVPAEIIQDLKSVKKARATYETAKGGHSDEQEIYDHLYRFFERYYDKGDFMSRRYFARETDGRAAPYAVPYDGREVYLHWANKDQYYIKTSEHLNNFTFDLSKSEHIGQGGLVKDADSALVHCRIVDATEGDHNNVKASEETERFFVVHEETPVKLTDDGLVLQFEYKPLPGKKYPISSGREKELKSIYGASNKGGLPILDMADKILAAIPAEAEAYKTNLQTLVPTDKVKKRPLLAKYLNKYTARNTMDYFIHKDLGGFLRRELDFYIKNEIMRLDDIELIDVPRVESYLAKIKVLRKIARYLIDILAQMEDFQKKLWLKKKFVTETHYCITLDRIPEKLYKDIAKNDAQREEWVRLFAIDELKGYKKPLSVKFLKDNPYLVLDTGFFDERFTQKLLAEIKDLDATMGEELIHSENFQALNLLRAKRQAGFDSVYIDPPYNTKSSEIPYKNTYKHSSWLAFMRDRIAQGALLLDSNGTHAVAIDEVEQEKLSLCLDGIFDDWRKVVVPIAHNPRGQQGKNVSAVHEYMILNYPSDKEKYLADKQRDEVDSRNMRNSGTESERNDAKTCFYPFIVRKGEIVEVGEVPSDNFHPASANVYLKNGDIEVWPISENGDEKKWRYARGSVHKIWDKLEAKEGRNNIQIIFHQDRGTMRSLWVGAQYDASEYGTKVLQKILGAELAKEFSYPKSIRTMKEALEVLFNNKERVSILDYFAGSGTTAHAIVEMTRERSDILVKASLIEMGGYFDVVLRPRLMRAIYSKDWKEGKPVSRDGISHAFKYIRLESYEDTLNNLVLRDDIKVDGSANFKQEYMLHYWLEFETRDSPSLLNIPRFIDPTAYKLKVKKTGADEYVEKTVDLIETFNWLIGLHVESMDCWRGYKASFEHEKDPKLPKDTATRLILKGDMTESDKGPWQFRKIEGYTYPDSADKTNRERTLVVWRKLTGDPERDNAMLDAWFTAHCRSAEGCDFDVVYVNGSNNLQTLRQTGETWEVRLLEKTFHQAMWDIDG